VVGAAPAARVADAGEGGEASTETPPPRSLDNRAHEAYAAIREQRLGDARRLLDAADESASHCWGPARATLLSNGGARVTAARGLVVTNAAGEIIHHEVVEGCLRYAEQSLRITSTEGALRIVENAHSAELTFEETGNPLAQRFFVSTTWAVAVDIGGDYVALNRADGRVLRGRHGADAALASHWMSPVGVALAGDRIVIDRGKQIALLRVDGSSVDVRGCSGRLLGASRTETGERALHVTTTNDESSDTRVCLVKDDGTTRAIVPLGSATCGLAGAMPCPFALQASTSRLLGFGSMRGGFVLVDAVAGRVAQVPLPRGAYPDGLSPGGFFGCGSGELCISYTTGANGDNGVSAVRMNGGKLTTRVPTKAPDPSDAWCELAGLPVPKAVCEAR